jgi:hypothetical protein
MSKLRIPLALLLAAALTGSGRAAEPVSADLGKEALALVQARCVRCHGADKPRAKLDLTTLESLRRGGKHGPAVVAGKPDDSLLWQQVHSERMPPRKPLPEAERTLLRRWIESGTPGPRGTTTHWAFRPVDRPSVPAPRHAEKVRTAIDGFIETALEQKGLTLGPDSDRAVLLRRLYFDLTGLPPTPAEIDAYLADSSPTAYEDAVERCLASPRYGERWGKYWLDTVGYADSNGYFSADSDRPLAWRYRDYVIRCFNEDRPYDRFVREQLAGDEMAGYVPDGDIDGKTAELLVATHFLRNAPDGSGESDGNPDEVLDDRFTVLEGTLQITINSLLGVTIQCARCHNHKFEPFTQEEYYRLQAIFFPAYCPDRWVKPGDRVVAVGSRAEREEHRRRTERIAAQVKALEESLQAIARPLREQLLDERLRPLPAATRAELRKALAAPKDKQTPEQAALLKKHPQAEISEKDLGVRFPEYVAVADKIRQAIEARKKEQPPPLDRLSVLIETDPKPPAHHVLLRGLHNAPGPEVKPGVLAAVTLAGNEMRPAKRTADKVSSGRRTAFADWVTSPKNPLFARVIVNRVWQHHFGTGLVASPDNLGRSGARPSHPELLDWLAAELVRSGWSIKALHRLILRSTVYRQASAPAARGQQIDPDNRLLWRFPVRRMDAEALRDALLCVTGEIDLRMGGPYVPTSRRGDGSVEVDEQHDGARRRAVYLQQRRTQVETLLELFDAPAMASTCAVRTPSTIPLQSLTLLNSDFIRKRARAFAGRLECADSADTDRRLTLAFRLAAGRAPEADERAAAHRFLAAQQALYAAEKDAARKAWTDLCQMILASNAFLYID